MNSYFFHYRKSGSWFWKKTKVVGHSIEYLDENKIIDNKVQEKIRKPQNAMVLYFEDGSIERIADWNSYDMKLGQDYFLFTKKQMEVESGQNIQTTIGK